MNPNSASTRYEVHGQQSIYYNGKWVDIGYITNPDVATSKDSIIADLKETVMDQSKMMNTMGNAISGLLKASEIIKEVSETGKGLTLSYETQETLRKVLADTYKVMQEIGANAL